MAFDPVQNLNKLYKENPHLMSVLRMAEKYGVERRRMVWIIFHPDNQFPSPKKVSPNGGHRLWCPDEVAEWMKGKKLLALPYVKGASFSYRKRKSANDVKPVAGGRNNLRPDLPEVGKGGKAVGSHLQQTHELLKMMGTRHGKR